MKRLCRCLVVGFAVTILLTSFAVAQQRVGVRVSIPFEFRVATEVYPSGDYEIVSSGPMTRDVLIITTAEGKSLQMAQTVKSTPAIKTGKPYLLFHRYGSESFLSEVWTEGFGDSKKFPVTRRERELVQTANSGKEGTTKLAMVVVPAN